MPVAPLPEAVVPIIPGRSTGETLAESSGALFDGSNADAAVSLSEPLEPLVPIVPGRVRGGGGQDPAPVSTEQDWPSLLPGNYGGRRYGNGGNSSPYGYNRALEKVEALETRSTPSVPVGSPSEGKLIRASELPLTGFGYIVARPNRMRNFGTDEMVAGLIWTGANLKRADAQMPDLAVGDISSRNGGDVSDHISHENGLDVDLMLFKTDESGRPSGADTYPSFSGNGKGASKGTTYLFDTRRNWALVRGLLQNPQFGPQIRFILIHEPLKKLLIRHARDTGEDEGLVRRAENLLQKPGDNVSNHSDHFHLRINPPPPAAKLAKR